MRLSYIFAALLLCFVSFTIFDSQESSAQIFRQRNCDPCCRPQLGHRLRNCRLRNRECCPPQACIPTQLYAVCYVAKAPGCGMCQATFSGGYWSVDPKNDCNGDDAAYCYCDTPPIGRSSSLFQCKNPDKPGNEASATQIYFGFNCDASGNAPSKRIFFKVPDSTVATNFNFKQGGWKVEAEYDPSFNYGPFMPIVVPLPPYHSLIFRHQDNNSGELIKLNSMTSQTVRFHDWKITITRY